MKFNEYFFWQLINEALRSPSFNPAIPKLTGKFKVLWAF